MEAGRWAHPDPTPSPTFLEPATPHIFTRCNAETAVSGPSRRPETRLTGERPPTIVDTTEIPTPGIGSPRVRKPHQVARRHMTGSLLSIRQPWPLTVLVCCNLVLLLTLDEARPLQTAAVSLFGISTEAESEEQSPEDQDGETAKLVTSSVMHRRSARRKNRLPPQSAPSLFSSHRDSRRPTPHFSANAQTACEHANRNGLGAPLRC